MTSHSLPDATAGELKGWYSAGGGGCGGCISHRHAVCDDAIYFIHTSPSLHRFLFHYDSWWADGRTTGKETLACLVTSPPLHRCYLASIWDPAARVEMEEERWPCRTQDYDDVDDAASDLIHLNAAADDAPAAYSLHDGLCSADFRYPAHRL